MARVLSFVYRLCVLGLAGAQVYFAAGAAQVAFPAEVAALPHAHPRRLLAGDLVGGMIARLDAATLAFTALAVVCAVVLSRRRAAILPLIAGLCALASAWLVTPAIHAMRTSGQTGGPRFGMLHGISSGLLLLEMLLLAAAGYFCPQPASARNGD